jgi:F-type H+-transporting ATPase subunit b
LNISGRRVNSPPAAFGRTTNGRAAPQASTEVQLMLKRIVLMLALATWIAAPAPAQEHRDAAGNTQTTHVDATGKPADVHAAGQGAVEGDHAAAAAGAHEGGEHEKAPLLPDPTSGETWMQALWVIIIFLVLLAVLYPTAWKSVLAGLKTREERIRKDIADAEAARARAEATLKEYNAQLATAENKIRDMLAKAAADGERVATNLKMQAQQESEEIKNRATREIESAKDQALAEVYEKTADLATSVAEKIIRRNLNPEDQRDLVARSLEQLQTVSKN